MEKSEYGGLRFDRLAFLDLEDSFWPRCACPKADAAKLCGLITRLKTLSATAHENGLLSLEGAAAELPFAIGRAALKMVIDGKIPAHIGSVCRTLLLLDTAAGAELLGKVICVHGVLCIQAGMDTDLMTEQLSAYLGAGEVLKAIEGKW